MDSKQVRKAFLDFFASKDHKIVPSAPMVIKNDPTLLFTNAGMNQFKDIFLGNTVAAFPRVANSQKCLRVSGKHNDLEEVGVDTYHHTMFEMLGNWSFGDYFKAEAIAWSWELLTEIYKLDTSRLYVTVFEGDEAEQIPPSTIALQEWKKLVAPDHIVFGNKKDNFWEMGETGPCGPCSEIHVDLRPDSERSEIPGHELVNKDHPQVIEIWNNVFIQYNRKKDGTLENLPQKHVDTGMGLERLVRVIQNKKSNYDTDIFKPLINHIEQKTGLTYGKNEKTDIAMRVLADHIRTISFAIAEGQLPSNNKAGYVIRRILRRAVRYAYTFLGQKEPFVHTMVKPLVNQMGDHFPEIGQQEDFIFRVIYEEETAFLKTLETGILKFNDFVSRNPGLASIPGSFVFELLDTYGFPKDLTQLMAKEIGWQTDLIGFDEHLSKQKERSRSASAVDTGDWIVLRENDDVCEFIGYERLETQVSIVRYREVLSKGKKQFHLIFNITPFYAESGGQVGDQGFIRNQGETIQIIDTKKEHGQVIHITEKLPSDVNALFQASVNKNKRVEIMRNHSATHLLHASLRHILGKHVEQKGSLVNDEYLRFDFSHFEKVSESDLFKIENMVNQKIRENILQETSIMTPNEARKTGAMALFGEKYGDLVRVVSFGSDFSMELCGGTHVEYTGNIGYFKIQSEGAIAAGVRRIEAVTGTKADELIRNNQIELQNIRHILKNPSDSVNGIKSMLDEIGDLKKKLEILYRDKANSVKENLRNSVELINNKQVIHAIVDLDSSELIKTISFDLRQQFPDLFLVLGNMVSNKPMIAVALGDNLVSGGMSASEIVKKLAKEIKGGGGGQNFFATAGGSAPENLQKAISGYKEFI